MLEKRTFARELKAGDRLSDVFVVAEAKLGQARNGPFWTLRLQDSSGQVEAKIWSPLSQEFTELKPETVVLVEGQAQSYREQIQVNIDSLRIVDPEICAIDWSLFIPCGPRDPEEMLAELTCLLDAELSHKPWKKLCRAILADDDIKNRLRLAPGAKSIHHAYQGGLLEHTLSVCLTCLSMADRYPGVDREILLVAAFLHDLGKAWELRSGIVRDYTDEGRLIGHIILGLEIVEPFLNKAKNLDPELRTHLKHILISHHGEYEYGSPRRPKTSEALILHYVDNLDAKLNTLAGCVPENNGEPAWSPYQPTMERFLYRARKTPAPENSGKSGGDKPKSDQCLLPLKE